MYASPLRTAALFGFAGIIVGSFLPWAKIWIFTAAGTDGDGVYTLVLGAAGVLCIVLYQAPLAYLVAALAALVSAAVGIYDLATIEDLGREIRLFGVQIDFKPEVGPGLYLTIGGAAVAAVACFARLVTQPAPLQQEVDDG